MNSDFWFYWLAIVITFCVWLVLFIYSKNTRKEMVITGILVTPFVVIDYFTVPMYWTPKTLFNIPVGIEGFIFTFFLSGIAAVIYEVVMRKRIGKKKDKFNTNSIVIFIAVTLFVILLFWFIKINIIYFIILENMFSSGVICFFRKDLLKDTIYSALFFSSVNFIIFTLWGLLVPSALNWWTIKGIRLGVIPIQELLFSFSFGAFVGPLYEYLTNGRIK